MSLKFLKAGTADAVSLMCISKKAFDSDVEVGASSVGGALLFLKDNELNIGRIFVDPEYFRKGYDIFMMQQIEESFAEAKVFTLDTPIWNVRTNAFYQKLGYVEVRRDGDFVYYEKRRDTE